MVSRTTHRQPVLIRAKMKIPWHCASTIRRGWLGVCNLVHSVNSFINKDFDWYSIRQKWRLQWKPLFDHCMSLLWNINITTIRFPQSAKRILKLRNSSRFLYFGHNFRNNVFTFFPILTKLLWGFVDLRERPTVSWLFMYMSKNTSTFERNWIFLHCAKYVTEVFKAQMFARMMET